MGADGSMGESQSSARADGGAARGWRLGQRSWLPVLPAVGTEYGHSGVVFREVPVLWLSITPGGLASGAIQSPELCNTVYSIPFSI